MTILAVVSTITVHWVAPLVGSLDRRAGGAPVLVLPRASPPVLVIMELWAGVALAAQPRWLLAWLCLVICQHVRCVQPLRVIVEETPLLVQAVGTKPVFVSRLLHLPLLPTIRNIISRGGSATITIINHFSRHLLGHFSTCYHILEA